MSTYDKQIIETLLENQKKFIKEQKNWKDIYTIYGKIYDEKEIEQPETESGWIDVTLPLIKRIFGEMFTPSNSACYVDFDYNEQKYYTIFGEEYKK